MSSFARTLLTLGLSAAVALAAGYAPAEPAAGPAPIPELAGRTAGPAQQCVPNDPGQSLRIVDSRTLEYGSGRTIWVNRLGSECPGMDRLDAVIVETTGTQYCRGDRVRSQEPTSNIPGPVCFLGDFVPYSR